MRLLLLFPTSPLPVFSGGRRRIYEVTRRLARRHELTILAFWRDEEARAGLAQLAAETGAEVVAVPFREGRWERYGPAAWRRAWRAWRGPLPADVVLWQRPGMQAALAQVLARQAVDLIQVEWPYLAPYALAHPHIPAVLITHDIFSVALRRRAGLEGRLRRSRLAAQARRWERYEAAMYPRLAAVAAMSAVDAEHIRRLAPTARVVILPNGVDTAALTPGPVRAQARHLLFVGSPTHAPNLDAACWLLETIWPRLKARHPELTLTLANLDHPQIRRRLGVGVECTGRLPDLTPLYRRADIALAPLRAGSGTRLKILEAFALGVPVVSTSLGHEGLEVTPGEHLLGADDAEAFVAAIERLLADADLRRRLAAQARRLVETHYDWEAIVARHERLYLELRKASFSPVSRA